MYYPESWAQEVWARKKKSCTRAGECLPDIESFIGFYNSSISIPDIERALVWSLTHDKAGNPRGNLWRAFRRLLKHPREDLLYVDGIKRCAILVMDYIDVEKRQRQLRLT